MYSVTYKSNLKSQHKNYQSERRALKAIWKWLKSNNGTAIFFSSGEKPRIFDDWRELPFDEPTKVSFYQSMRWLKLRSKAFELYGNKCSCCGSSPENGAMLHVDHIKPKSLYPELALDIENLQILCERCNIGKSNLSETQWR